MALNQLQDNPGAHKRRRRVGRGIGSGRGKTCGSGGKGQTARSGVSIHGFEGGQMPLHRRLPKRGFTNIFRKRYVEINLGMLQKAIEAGLLNIKEPITAAVLKKAGLIKRVFDGVRILGKGELKSSLQLEVMGASKTAVSAIEKQGGSLKILLIKPLPTSSV